MRTWYKLNIEAVCWDFMEHFSHKDNDVFLYDAKMTWEKVVANYPSNGCLSHGLTLIRAVKAFWTYSAIRLNTYAAEFFYCKNITRKSLTLVDLTLIVRAQCASFHNGHVGSCKGTRVYELVTFRRLIIFQQWHSTPGFLSSASLYVILADVHAWAQFLVRLRSNMSLCCTNVKRWYTVNC